MGWTRGTRSPSSRARRPPPCRSPTRVCGPGSTHTYSVEALDEIGNEGNKVTSGPIPVMAAVFADDFTAWPTGWSTVTRISLDVANGSSSAPSVRGNPTSQSAFAYADLPTTLTTVCVSANVNVANRTTALDLIRLRTAANGAIAKVYLDSQGRLIVRSDFASTQQTSGVMLPAGWNRIELCGSDATASGSLGSLPEWLSDRERLGGEHGHDACWPDPDRRHRRQDMDGELGRRDRGYGGRLTLNRRR